MVYLEEVLNDFRFHDNVVEVKDRRNNFHDEDHLSIFLNVQPIRNSMMIHLLMMQVVQQLIMNLMLLMFVVDLMENLKIE